MRLLSSETKGRDFLLTLEGKGGVYFYGWGRVVCGHGEMGSGREREGFMKWCKAEGRGEVGVEMVYVDV